MHWRTYVCATLQKIKIVILDSRILSSTLVLDSFIW